MKNKIRWSSKLAYIVGIITTDGNLSKDGRHITIVSKDIEQLLTFEKILKTKNKISTHISSYNPKGHYYHIQFSNVTLYNFLQKIGITPNKSLIVGKLQIPDKYFSDFLRGNLDGDGNISVVAHNESQYPQLRLRFSSASTIHLQWLKTSISSLYNTTGGFISKPNNNTRMLIYAKSDALKILAFIYYDGVKYFLQRKYKYYLEGMSAGR